MPADGKVVAGFGDSAGSHDALRLGQVLADALDLPLHVAIALPYEPLPLPLDAYDDALEQHYADLFGAAERDLGDGTIVRRELRDRSPAHALTELAENEPVAVTVVGSAEGCDEGRVRPSNVGHRLLSGAPTAVAIAPRGYARRAPETLRAIGVAYDGTPEAKEALTMGERLADRTGAMLRVVAVVPEIALLPSRIGHTRKGYAKFVHKHFEDVLAAVPGELGGDVEPELVLREGLPAETLAQMTSDLDLLITGSRGYGPVRRALLGGMASELVRRARCPVLVTPRR